jgi:hypothetical protein
MLASIESIEWSVQKWRNPGLSNDRLKIIVDSKMRRWKKEVKVRWSGATVPSKKKNTVIRSKQLKSIVI